MATFARRKHPQVMTLPLVAAAMAPTKILS